jgi:hypothetical protein
MNAPKLTVPAEAPTAATDVLRETRKANGFRNTIAFVGGLRNLFAIPQSVRKLAAYAKKWRRPPLKIEKQHAAVPRSS